MMTTTTFKIVLILLSMGMNVLMSHSTTPAMTRAMRIDSSDMIDSFSIRCLQFHLARPLAIESSWST
jgi:hypothetical protein